MGKFDGKTLLVLGSNVSSVDIVEYARKNGAYVIVADYYPPERSEAKRFADKSYMISTADIDSLNEVVRKENVDGILAGISEFNLLKAMELCEKNNMPFYCTKQQWDMIESKECFRKLCSENGVPCPKTYFYGKEVPENLWESFEYPLVLKPVDSSASAGVFICQNEKELKEHIPESIENSDKKTFIIEKFVKGNEFTAHYTICGGKASLACIDNRYPVSLHEGKVTTIPVARIYPSVYAEEYIEKVNGSVLRMCESIGVQDGILFVQGIHNPETHEYSIFEAGLRCAGEAPYRFLKEITGRSFISILVDHALLGFSDYDVNIEKPLLDGKCCGIVSFVAHHGIVGSISGLEETVARNRGVIEYENRYPVGREVPDTDTLRQLMLRFVMVCGNRKQLAEDVEMLNNGITILDENGKNMVLKFSPERLFEIQ